MYSGILVLDKPTGISSGEYIRKLKNFLTTEKVGHAGTLDPLATGLLIACLGQMTRFSDYLADLSKSYEVEILLGFQTNTGDIDGEEIKKTDFIPSENDIKKAIKNFIGKINQIPPIYSALKHKGKPLYKYAREGIDIKIEPRKILIHQINFISYYENILKLEITCGKGAYMRVLAEDIAKKAGSLGTVANLRRIKTAGFEIDNSIIIDELNHDNFKEKIITPGDALQRLDDIQCRPEIIEKITKGQKVEMILTSEDKFLRLFDKKGNFVGIIENCNGFIKPKRLLTID